MIGRDTCSRVIKAWSFSNQSPAHRPRTSSMGGIVQDSNAGGWADGFGPYFALSTTGSPGRWRPVSELLSDPSILAERVEHTRTTVLDVGNGAADARAVASMVALGLSGLMLTSTRMLMLTSTRMSWAPGVGRGTSAAFSPSAP